MAESLDTLLEEMEAGQQLLSCRLTDLLDGHQDDGRLGMAYSAWVLPSAMIVLSGRDHHHEVHEDLAQACDQIEISLAKYLESSSRSDLLKLSADWLGARAAGNRLCQLFS